MKTKLIQALGAATIALTLAGGADAQENIASRNFEIGKACEQAGGRLDVKWLYDDGAARYGRVATCTTGEGYVACQDDICHPVRWTRGKDVAATFNAMLAALAGE